MELRELIGQEQVDPRPTSAGLRCMEPGPYGAKDASFEDSFVPSYPLWSLLACDGGYLLPVLPFDTEDPEEPPEARRANASAFIRGRGSRQLHALRTPQRLSLECPSWFPHAPVRQPGLQMQNFADRRGGPWVPLLLRRVLRTLVQ